MNGDEKKNKTLVVGSSEPNTIDDRNFNSIKEDESPYLKLLEKRQQSIEKTSAEEIKLRQRIEKTQEKRSKLEREVLKSKAKIYGYTDLGELSVDLSRLEKGELPSKPHLFKTKEEYEAAKAYTPELEKAAKQQLIKETGLFKDLDVLEERKATVAERGFASSIQRELTNLPTKTNVLSRESEIAITAAADIQKRPFFDYSKQRKIQQEEQEKLSEAVSTTSQDISTPEGLESYLSSSQQLELKTRETAQSLARERAQKKRGFDIESQFERAGGFVEAEKQRLGTQQVREDIGKGRFGSLQDEFKKLEDIGKKLNTTFEKFNKEIEDTGTAVEDTRKELEAQTEQYKKQKQITDEMQRAGYGSGASKLETFGKVLNAGTAVADAVRYSFITSDIQQKQARAGVADIVNQEYGDYRSAARGDMAALRRVSGFYQRATVNAAELKAREQVVGGAEVGLATAGSVAEGIKEGSKAGLNLVGGAVGGTIAALPSAMGAIKQGVDVGKGITSTNTYIQSFQADRHLEDTAMKIRDIHRQELFDYGTNMYEGVQGFGVSASKTFESFAAKEARDKFASLGLAPGEVIPLMGQAGAQMGAAFTGASVESQQETVKRAAELQQSRMMSAQQYVGNLGQLTQVGGGSKQMEEIMANAVARGVGNAKNITDIVGLVTAISSKTGANTAAGVTAIVGRSLGNLSNLMPGQENERLRQSMTATAMERVNERMSSTSMDFSSVVGYAELGTRFRGVSAAGRVVAQRDLKIEHINEMEALNQQMKSGNKKEAEAARAKFETFIKSTNMEEFFINKKTGRLEGADGRGVEQTIQDLRESKQKSLAANLLGLGEGGIQAGEVITGKRKEISGEARSASGLIMGPGTTIEAVQGVMAKGEAPKSAVPNDLSGGAKEIRDIQVERARVEGKGIQAGFDDTGAKSVSDTFKTIATEFKEAMKGFDPAAMQAKAVQAANEMTTDFKGATSEFKSAVSEFREAIKLMPAVSTVKTEVGRLGSTVTNIGASNNEEREKANRGTRANPSLR